MPLLNLGFRYKLLVIFFLFCLCPLFLLAVFVFQRVQSTYQVTLEESFTRNAQIRQQILELFLENNKSWIKTLASQDILLAPLENNEASKSAGEEDKVFASLMSIRRENPFIERAYILNTEGVVILSTATDDVGSKLGLLPFLTVPLKERTTYIDRIMVSPYNKRVIPLSEPLISKDDNLPVGVLVVELNSSIIKALYKGKLYSSSKSINDNENGIEAYVIDNDGYPLTELKKPTIQETVNIDPVVACTNSDKSLTGIWKSYAGENVFGVSQCLRFGGIHWTVVVEQPTQQAFAISRQLGITILLISLLVGTVLFFVFIPVTKSITNPITDLRRGAELLGGGDLDYRINLVSGDELEELGKSFNDMAGKLKSLVFDLRRDKEMLEVQKERLNQNARLLLRRDMDLHEVNDELETEKDLAEAERNKFEMVLSGIADGVIAVDLNRKIITINSAAEFITGYNRKEITGMDIDKVISIFDKNDVVKVTDYCPLRPGSFEGIVFTKTRLKLLGNKGKTAYVNFTSGQIKEASSIKLGCIMTFHDITQEQELERMKVDFVSMAAHELRTPLTTAQGYLSFLLQTDTVEKLNGQEKEFLNRVNLSTSTLNKLIENLLVVSRIEQGKLKIDPQRLQIEMITNKLVKDLQGLAQTKGLVLTASMALEPLPPVMADPIRIEEVISNLIVNAINYTQKGEICVSVSRTDKNVQVSIADTGQGIPAEAIPHLFSKFFRVQGVLEAGSKGTGLGLYISKNIIDAHHGRIWVESVPGIGSKFSFTLPVALE